MTGIAIDIAWSRPSVAQIRATGASGVLRYFSTDSTKNLHPDEVRAYHAAGLGVGDVWETTTGRARQGYQAGIDDAGLANGQRQADGLPADQSVYFAVDEDTDWASVAPYFNGASQVLGQHQVGVYGGFRVIEGAYAAGYRLLWQTLAWSGGRRSAHASLYQDGRTVLGGNADVNQILASDWGQYPHPTTLEVDVNLSDKMPSYATIQTPNGPYTPTVGECLNGAKQADSKLDALDAKVSGIVAALTADKTELDQIKAGVAQVFASLTSLAASGSVTAAQVQAGVQAELVKLGQLLGGMK